MPRPCKLFVVIFLFQSVLQQEMQYDRMLKELKGLKNVQEVGHPNFYLSWIYSFRETSVYFTESH